MSWWSLAVLLLPVGSFMWLYLAGHLVGNRVSKMFSFAHWGLGSGTAWRSQLCSTYLSSTKALNSFHGSSRLWRRWKFKLQGFSLDIMWHHFCHILLVITSQGHSGFKGRKLEYSTSGSSGKAPLQKSTHCAIFGNNWQKEKETIFGSTGDVGK